MRGVKSTHTYGDKVRREQSDDDEVSAKDTIRKPETYFPNDAIPFPRSTEVPVTGHKKATLPKARESTEQFSQVLCSNGFVLEGVNMSNCSMTPSWYTATNYSASLSRAGGMAWLDPGPCHCPVHTNSVGALCSSSKGQKDTQSKHTGQRQQFLGSN